MFLVILSRLLNSGSVIKGYFGAFHSVYVQVCTEFNKTYVMSREIKPQGFVKSLNDEKGSSSQDVCCQQISGKPAA